MPQHTFVQRLYITYKFFEILFFKILNISHSVENSRKSVYLLPLWCFFDYGNTLDLFNWNDRAGLVSWQWPFTVHAIHADWSSSIRLVYRRNMGSQGVVLGMSATEKQGERMTKGLQWKYSHRWRMHVWCCLTLLHPQTSVCPRKSQSSACIFLSFCLAPSLAHSLASFIISLLSVNLAPCLPLCLSFFPLPILLLHPFLPPTSHLCMCHFQL